MTDGMNVTRVGGLTPAPANEITRATGTEETQKSFKEMLFENIEKADRLQKEAEAAMSRLGTGETDPVREALAAAQKAEMAFKTLMQIRDGIMAAYQEINDMRFS